MGSGRAKGAQGQTGGRGMMLSLTVAVLLGGSGCLVRPWAIEESDRISQVMENEVDETEADAFAGIEAPHGLSPRSPDDPDGIVWSEPMSWSKPTKRGKVRSSKAQVTLTSASRTKH